MKAIELASAQSNCGSWCVFGNCNSRNINPRQLKSVKERNDISDLEEQVRDFVLFIEAQKVLGTRSNGAELRSLRCGCKILHPAIRAPELYVWERRNDEPLLQHFCKLFSSDSFGFSWRCIVIRYPPTAIVHGSTNQYICTT